MLLIFVDSTVVSLTLLVSAAEATPTAPIPTTRNIIVFIIQKPQCLSVRELTISHYYIR